MGTKSSTPTALNACTTGLPAPRPSRLGLCPNLIRQLV
jgi:hypothetical protein